MIMKTSEVLDRLTILIMKAEFDDNAKKELDLFINELQLILSDNTGNTTLLKELFIQTIKLSQANAKSWELEASIRKEFKKDRSATKNLSLEEVGKRTIAIRDFNKNRVESKKKIDILFNEIPENKIDHLSA